MSQESSLRVPCTGEPLVRALVLSTRYKPDAHPIARDIARWLEARGVSVHLDLAGESNLLEAGTAADLAVIVGGDGTILGVARRFAGLGIPAIGVNIGKLGFLAEFSAEECLALIGAEPTPAGTAPPAVEIVPRMMLRTRVSHRGKKEFVHSHVCYALNDAVIAQGVPSRLLNIELCVDGRKAATYMADGVIVSTPVGSTAYSLSVGGPILTPSMQAFIVTPISPHSLTNRPMVLEPSRQLQLKVLSHADALALVLDGQDVRTLDRDDEVEVRAAERPFRLMSHAGRSFFELLRAKFHWAAPPAYGAE